MQYQHPVDLVLAVFPTSFSSVDSGKTILQMHKNREKPVYHPAGHQANQQCVL